MATTTVRLSAAEERLLDELAASYGGRSNAIRQALKLLAARAERQRALTDLLEEWAEEPADSADDAVEAFAEHYGL
ncbi:MAG: hypothetical protein AAGD35_14135 [Actinomycetota bacterium]